jgi:hypothetical protein
MPPEGRDAIHMAEKKRIIPYDDETAVAIHRYLRARNVPSAIEKKPKNASSRFRM